MRRTEFGIWNLEFGSKNQPYKNSPAVAGEFFIRVISSEGGPAFGGRYSEYSCNLASRAHTAIVAIKLNRD